jgi:hypothetical protein
VHTSHVHPKAFLVLSSMLVALIGTPSFGQVGDIATHPILGEIEFENDSITVLRVHMAPHERTPMHDIASPRLVIWLTNAHLKDIGADGSVSEYTRAAGSTEWITPRRHMGENLSDHHLEFVAVIPKVISTPTLR